MKVYKSKKSPKIRALLLPLNSAGHLYKKHNPDFI